MPSTRYIVKVSARQTVLALVFLLVLSVCLVAVVPTAKASAASAEGTTLGIVVIDSSGTQGGPDTGKTKLGIRVTDSENPIKTNYLITLDRNDGTDITSTVNVTYNLPLPKVEPPTREGHTFQGYYDNKSMYGIKYYDSNGEGVRVWDKTTAAPLYAHWSADMYHISFDPCNGDFIEVVPTYYGAQLSKPSRDPERIGYTFDGWYVDGKDGVKWDFSLPVTSFFSLSAHWIPDSYDISYDLAGGTATGSNPETYTIETDDFTLSEPKKTGYTFDGWSGIDISGVQKSATVTKGSTGKRNYTAQWTAKSYRVTLDRDGGKDGDFSTTATYDSAMQQVAVPNKDGYTFAGYFDNKGKQYYDEEGKSKANWDKDAENVTLKARWTLQINCTFPSNALVQVDASGKVTGQNLEFSSSTVEDLKVTTIASVQDAKAPSLFANGVIPADLRIVLTPSKNLGNEVKVPLTSTGEVISQGGWTIAAGSTSTPTKFAVAFSLFLPSSTQLNYFPDSQVSLASLSYEVVAANAS